MHFLIFDNSSVGKLGNIGRCNQLYLLFRSRPKLSARHRQCVADWSPYALALRRCFLPVEEVGVVGVVVVGTPWSFRVRWLCRLPLTSRPTLANNG